MKRNKRTTNDLQNNRQKTKDQTRITPLVTMVNLGAPEGKTVPAPR